MNIFIITLEIKGILCNFELNNIANKFTDTVIKLALVIKLRVI